MNHKKFSDYLVKAHPTENKDFDLRFEEIVSLIEQERFKDATPHIERVLDEGCLDIRLVMYLFYAQFLEKGLSSLSDLFTQILVLLSENQEKISPLNMREKHTQNSLIWFFSTLGKKLRRSERLFKENRPDAFWTESVTALTPETLEELKQKTTLLHDYFSNDWGEHPILHHLLFLKKWISEFNPVPEKPLFSPPPSEDIAEEIIELPSKEEPSAEESPPSSIEKNLSQSFALKSLSKKLETFEHLITKRDFTKAALVAKDIKHLIETFNPTSYFPKLFTNYLSLTAKHISTLSEEWENADSLTWNSLEQLYHADLDAFIHW